VIDVQMPYTVNFFLEQVSRGLFDGSSFHRNAGHVVQGGPTPNHTNKGTNLNRPFHDAGLVSVGFQEYSAEFPHVKYTLGYAGRPGGPDFYVSTVGKSFF
jgi:cyclophilin family peptidyl-prolyl cis-trans isomerase